MKQAVTSGDNGLHGVISKKIEFFITKATRTSDPTKLDGRTSHKTPDIG
jgi:hypothetical protein